MSIITWTAPSVCWCGRICYHSEAFGWHGAQCSFYVRNLQALQRENKFLWTTIEDSDAKLRAAIAALHNALISCNEAVGFADEDEFEMNTRKVRSRSRSEFDEFSQSQYARPVLSNKRRSRVNESPTPRMLREGRHIDFLGDVKILQDMIQNGVSALCEMAEMIRTLKGDSHKLTQKVRRLEMTILEIEKSNAENSISSGSYVDSAATPTMFQSAVQKAEIEAARLAKVLQQHLRCQGLDIAKLVMNKFSAQQTCQHLQQRNFEGLSSLVNYVSNHNYSRAAHIKFGLQSWICLAMFDGFENDVFCLDNGVCPIINRKVLREASLTSYARYSSLNAADMIAEEDNILFKKFLDIKFSKIVPDEGVKRDISRCTLPDCTPQRELYSSFISLARCVWLLHTLARGFDPGASIFRAGKYMHFDGFYMESIISAESEGDRVDQVQVELMVMPGFQIRNSVIKSKIYLSKTS